MTGYDFHPEARFDLDEIWEFILARNRNPKVDIEGGAHGPQTMNVHQQREGLGG